MYITEKIDLKARDYSLADVVDMMIDIDSNYIRNTTQEKIDQMPDQSEFDVVAPFIIVKVYKTHEDKKKHNYLNMVFGNYGLIPYCNGDVLEDYKLDEPRFFWNFRLTHLQSQAKHYQYPDTYNFSSDKHAIETWTASLNFDEIFEEFAWDCSGDWASFAGFFFAV